MNEHWFYWKNGETTQQQLADEKNEEEVCRIVASHTFAVYLLPQLMKELIVRFPKIKFSIAFANSHESLEQVAKHEADFGFIEKPLETTGVQRFSLLEDALVVAGDPKSELWLVRGNLLQACSITRNVILKKRISKGRKMLVKVMRSLWRC